MKAVNPKYLISLDVYMGYYGYKQILNQTMENDYSEYLCQFDRCVA